MNATEKIKSLDILINYYSSYQHNLLQNYKNQLLIYIGLEDQPLSYSQSILPQDLHKHPLYEPIIEEGEHLNDELIKLSLEQSEFIEKILKWENDFTISDSFIEEESERLNRKYKNAKFKIKQIEEKAKIHNFIFKIKMSKNKERVSEIKKTLNSDFYNSIDSLPKEEFRKQFLNALEKVVPIYQNVLSNYKDTKPLKELIKINNHTEILIPTKKYSYINENGISDFLHLWNVKNDNGEEISDKIWKKAKKDNLIFYINKNGYCDTNIVDQQENDILIFEDALIFENLKVIPNYLLLLLNLECYQNLSHYYYHKENNRDAILDFHIPIPNKDVQAYFSEAMDRYFFYKSKYNELLEILKEAKNILKLHGENVANYFLDLKIEGIM